MVYYRLQSEYEGDITKNCGLTIDEVDNNFYELEDKLYNLIDRLEERLSTIDKRLQDIEDKMTCVSETMHDTDICPPGTSNDATYMLSSHYQMNIGGVVDFDTEHGGNRFGVAIKPNENNKSLYPDAKFYIYDKDCGNLWDEIDNNPETWPEALYLYPKVERKPESWKLKVSLGGETECNNILRIKIQWDDEKSETYYYIVDENITLKPEVI